MGKDQLLELGFLTEEEKDKLQKVLAADENLQKTQYNYFIKKHKDLYNERKQCAAHSDVSVCPLCFVKFGWFTNSGDNCPVPACELKVCNNCRVNSGSSWLCLLCHKEKDLKAQAGYWFQQPSKNKKRVKTGTDILKKSLDTAIHDSGKNSPSLLELTTKKEPSAENQTETDSRQQEDLSNAPDHDIPKLSENHVPPDRSKEMKPVFEPENLNHTKRVELNNHVVHEMVVEPSKNLHKVNSPHLNIPSISCNNRVSQTEIRDLRPITAKLLESENLSEENSQPPATEPIDEVEPKRNLKAPHIRDIKGQSLSADSGFINDDTSKEDSIIPEMLIGDDDDNSIQFQKYLVARSVAPDELAPHLDTPPTSPQLDTKIQLDTVPNSTSSQQLAEDHMSAGASSSNISCDSISPSPTMIKANTRDRLIKGELLVGLVFNEQVSTLDVHINEGRNLAGVDGNPPHCYIKTYLLPDRSKTAKRKTKTKKRAANPVFNEIFQYKAASTEDLASSTLWLTAWDSRQLGHNMFLGEVRIQLSSVSLEENIPQWCPLQHMEDSHFRGSLLLSLMYCPSPDDSRKKKKTSLKLKIVEARDLPVMDHGRTNPYAALYLLPKPDRDQINKDQNRDQKYKLQMKKNTTNPKWNAEVTFQHLDSSVIEEHGIEIQLLHLGKVEKTKQCVLIGVVRLCQNKTHLNPALDGRGIEVLHWKEALLKPGVWIEKWHNLRCWQDTW